MSEKLTIALAQTKVDQNKDINLDTAKKYMSRAASLGADLIVFPEMFMACPQKDTPLANIAEPLDGAFTSALADMARQYSMAVVCGLWECVEGEEKRAANVAIALDAQGSLLTRYNKIHLFNALSVREADQMLGGNTPPEIFEVNGVKIGLAICYDLRFPELFRHHAQNGADLVLVPAAWYSGPLKEDHWLCLLRARAIENTMYVAGIDLCGGTFSGRSTCFDPFGVPLVDAGEDENLVIANIACSRIKEVREKLPCLNHTRKELFR